MTRLILIDLAGLREVREVSEAVFIPSPPPIIMCDSRPWVRRPLGNRDMDDPSPAYVYQEVAFSSLDPPTKVHPRQEDCAIAETENRNLRAILADVAQAAPQLRDLIRERLDKTVEAGGVTETSAEDEREVIRDLMTAAGELADLTDHMGTVEADRYLGRIYEQARTVRSKITEVEDALLPTLYEARGKA